MLGPHFTVFPDITLKPAIRDYQKNILTTECNHTIPPYLFVYISIYILTPAPAWTEKKLSSPPRSTMPQ